MQTQMQTRQLFALQHYKDYSFLQNRYGVPYIYTNRDAATKSLYRNFRGVADNYKYVVVEIVIQQRMP